MRWHAAGPDTEAIERAVRELGWQPAEIQVLQGFGDRLLGFTVRPPELPHGRARVLVFPRCASLHTCFMRFALDIAFADARGGVLEAVEAVEPWRFCSHPGASFALERASSRAPCERPFFA